MKLTKACQSYRPKEAVCADGFIQKPFCSGHGACFSCGHHNERSTPWCMRDDIPERWLKPDGSPLFYRPAGRAALEEQP